VLLRDTPIVVFVVGKLVGRLHPGEFGWRKEVGYSVLRGLDRRVLPGVVGGVAVTAMKSINQPNLPTKSDLCSRVSLHLLVGTSPTVYEESWTPKNAGPGALVSCMLDSVCEAAWK
jgi:hypothetical protein